MFIKFVYKNYKSLYNFRLGGKCEKGINHTAYGCQMNVNESAKIKKIFQNLGYDVTEEIDNADAVFLNTCTVREGAATQIFGKLGELKALKEKRGTIIGVTGLFCTGARRRTCKKISNNRYKLWETKI